MSDDPMVTDPQSGVEHDSVVTGEECQTLLSKAWEPMIEQRVHVHQRPFHHGDDVIDGLVVVARGEAARMINAFIRDEVPSFEECVKE